MRLLEFQVFVKGAVTLKTPDDEQEYESVSAIPYDYMNYRVNSVFSENNRVIIQLDYPKEVKSLEDLGYNFECGM